VFDPQGREVTDDFAPDHAHQHGMFFAWVNASFEGRKVDFWNQKKRQGDVRHVRIECATGGPVFAQFSAVLLHEDFTAADGPKPVLQETWTIRVYNASEYFLFDLESTQKCVADSPLKVLEYHYGGMGLRGNRTWRLHDSRAGDAASDFLTSEQMTRANGNHSRPVWNSLFGRIDGRFSTITAMGSKDNFRFPQPVRLHPTMPYFCFAPMVLGEFEIQPGQSYTSKYRFCIRSGKPDPRLYDRLWHDYAEPPNVKVCGAAL
jgi:hypothetical protein